MDIVRAAHRFGTQGGLQKNGCKMPWVGFEGGARTVVATSSVVCCKVYKLPSWLFLCTTMLLLWSFFNYILRRKEKRTSGAAAAAKKGVRKKGNPAKPKTCTNAMVWLWPTSIASLLLFSCTLHLHVSLL